MKFPSDKEDWKKFEQNNEEVALNIFFAPHNKKEITPAYISKYNDKRKNQVILLMITDGERWHYLAVISLSALLRGISSSNKGDFYNLNCFHSYRTLNKLKKHERLCNNPDYCHVHMPEEGKNILKYSPRDKSLKAPFISYADLECLLKKKKPRQNNIENPYKQRKANHKPSGYSLSLNCSFDETKNRHNFYIGRDCIKRFCNDLKELAAEIINYKEDEMTPLKDKEIALYKSQKVCHICKEKFFMIKIRKANILFITKSEIIAITPGSLEELLIIFAI